MPAPFPYPKSGSVIKTSMRNHGSVLAAVKAVNATSHQAAITLLGGANAVANAIWPAISALPGVVCTILAVMTQMMTMMMIMQSMLMKPVQDAVYAILVKLT